MLAAGRQRHRKKRKSTAAPARTPASNRKTFPVSTATRDSGLASNGKIVRFSRSAGICRAVVVMAITREETQISNRQISFK